MNTELTNILSYEHPEIVKRFKKDFPEDAHRAEELFKDMLRFFWVSKQHSLDKKTKKAEFDFTFIMDEEMNLIDKMWHIFLLYTEDYMNFCYKYFGEYLHHRPDIVPTLPQDPKFFEENLEKFLSYTYDHLGEDVVKRWFNVDEPVANTELV